MSIDVFEFMKSIKPVVIVHSRAFSHRKVANDIKRVRGGILASYNDYYDTFGSSVIIVSTIDYIDIAMSSRFIVPSAECTYYGVAEGVPVVTPIARDIVEKCRVVTPSVFAREMVERSGVRVDEVIPHAVVLENPVSREVRWLRAKTKKCNKVIGWIGANQVRKGLDIVFKIAGLLNDYCFLVISGGGEIAVKNVPRNVIFIDEVYRLKSVSSLFEVIDVFLSTSRSEGFGLPVFEALAYGKPVVAPAIPVYREFGFLREFLYRVSGPRYVLYKNYMWMQYWEPDVEDAAKRIEEMVNTRVDDSIVREVRETLSLELYRGL